MLSFVRTRGVTRLLFTSILLLCACGAPVVLRGPAASASLVEGPLPVKLSIQAVDPSGGRLTYTWQQVPASPGGTFSDPTSSNPTWLAPVVKSSTVFTLQVTVTDANGGSTQGEVKVTVQPPAKRSNHAPVFDEAPVAIPSVAKAGDTLTFSVRASDPDGDALTYLWRQVGPAPRGTFVSDADGRSVTWFSPAVGAETAFALEVLVSDGHGAPVRRTVTVPVRVPRYTEDIQSLWDSLCTGCHGRSGGLELAAGKSHPALVGVHAETKSCDSFMRVSPGDPDGSALMMKVSGTGCGSRMPRNNPTYFDAHPDQLVRIRSWILGGAPKN